MEKECSGGENIEKLIGGEGGRGETSIRHSRVGTKFRLKMTLEKGMYKIST